MIRILCKNPSENKNKQIERNGRSDEWKSLKFVQEFISEKSKEQFTSQTDGQAYL